MSRILALVLLLLPLSAAQADQRIEHIDYSPDRVYTVSGQRSIQTMIEFALDETIENIALGDATAWQVTPNKRANLLFVKPLLTNARTNMTVVTDKRRYLFELINAAAGRRQPFAIRFVYPEDRLAEALLARQTDAVLAANGDAPAAAPPPALNRSWKLTGDKRISPAQIYDDGTSTFIAWSKSSELPGIFITGTDGSEGPVNFTVQGDYIVVDGVAPEYILRIGKALAKATNLAPREPLPVAAKPSPAESSNYAAKTGAMR